MADQNRFRDRAPLPVMLAGLLSLYVAERALTGAAQKVLLGCGLLALLAVGLAAWRVFSCSGERRQATKRVLAEYLLVLLGVLMYFVQSDHLGLPSAGRWHTMLQVAWPAVLMLGLLPAIMAEQALTSMKQAPRLEVWRVGLAAQSARIIVLGAIGFAGLNYAASAWNRKIDLSYFKTAMPGSSTLALVRGLTQPIRFVLFFPPGNEVLEQARSYVETLATESKQVAVEVKDQAMEPELSRTMKVRANGYLAMVQGEKTETVRLGLELEDARSTLRALDAKVHEKLMALVRPGRVAYLTTGHMERDHSPPNDDHRLGLRDLRMLLETLGFRVERLGLSEGLGNQIPDNASLVMVVGPTEPFLAEERTALQKYLERGGRVFLFADPDTAAPDEALLDMLGVQVTKNLVANDRYLVRIEGRGESPYFLVTTRSSAHPAVDTISRASGRLHVVLLGSGAISKAEQAPADLKVTFTLRSMQESWLDQNSNQKPDQGLEQRTALDFAAAIERPLAGAGADQKNNQMRAIVVADADLAGDGLVRNAGNAYFLGDGIRWLVGDEQTAGTLESEEDVPIVHRKDEDTIWFYGTSFVAPALVLAAGFFVARRGRTTRREG